MNTQFYIDFCFYLLLLKGTAAPQLTPIQQDADFVDSLEVKNFIQLKGYFKGSLNGWDHVFDGVMHQDLAFCAFGALASHLTRLMVSPIILACNIENYT